MLGKWLEKLSMNGGTFENLKRLLLADDTVLVADSDERLCRLVSEFGRVCEIKFRVNVSKSKFMSCSRYVNGGQMYVKLNGEPLKEVDCFKHLVLQVAAYGRCERDVVHRMNEGYRAWGALKSLLSNRGLGINAKKCLYEGVIVPMTFYNGGMRSAEGRKGNVLEMKCLRSLVGVSRIYRVMNEEVHRRSVIQW